MGNHVFEIIKKYAAELPSQTESAETGTAGWKLMMKAGTCCYETADGADLHHLRETDIVLSADDEGDFAIERRILKGNEEIGAVVISKTNYCMKALKKGLALRAALDDMAQIVGYEVRTVSYDEEEVRAALGDASGCFVRNRYTVTTGRNLFEAVVALEVLEKSAEVNLKAEVLGGPCFIDEAEARFMRKNYKENYSREETLIKSKEEGLG